MAKRRPTALILIAEGFHEIEAFVPYYRFLEIGWQVKPVSPQRIETIRGAFGMHFSEFVHVSKCEYEQADILIIPGGRSARYIVTRHMQDVKPLIEHFFVSGKPTAAISHGPLVLVHAQRDVLSDIEMTGRASIAPEIQPYIRSFLDKPCVISNNIVTSRSSEDLHFFVQGILHVLFQRDLAVNAATRS